MLLQSGDFVFCLSLRAAHGEQSHNIRQTHNVLLHSRKEDIVFEHNNTPTIPAVFFHKRYAGHGLALQVLIYNHCLVILDDAPTK